MPESGNEMSAVNDEKKGQNITVKRIWFLFLVLKRTIPEH
jgi:hypothetical protein